MSGLPSGWPASADAPDAVRFEEAGLDEAEGGVVDAERLRRAAAEHQHVADLSARREAAEAIGEVVAVADEAGGNVRHRLEPMGAHGGGGGDLAVAVGGIDEGDEDLGARLEPSGNQGELVDLTRRDLDRQAA